MRHHMYNPDFKFVVEPEHFNKYTDRELLQYCLGATMYMPGYKDFTPKILSNAMPGLTTIVLCFEDACPEERLPEAMENVHHLLATVTDTVDKGQMEAGISMGFTKIQTMQYIILPQALKNALPPLCNEFISLLKETAIVGYVALSDLTRVANQISSATYQPFMPLIGAALIYFVLIKILSSLVKLLEKRLNKYDIC